MRYLSLSEVLELHRLILDSHAVAGLVPDDNSYIQRLISDLDPRCNAPPRNARSSYCPLSEILKEPTCLLQDAAQERLSRHSVEALCGRDP